MEADPSLARHVPFLSRTRQVLNRWRASWLERLPAGHAARWKSTFHLLPLGSQEQLANEMTALHLETRGRKVGYNAELYKPLAVNVKDLLADISMRYDGFRQACVATAFEADDTPSANFASVCSESTLFKIAQELRLISRSVSTKSCAKLPDNWEVLQQLMVARVTLEIHRPPAGAMIPPELFVNMDEVFMPLLMMHTRSLAIKGSQSVQKADAGKS